MVLIYDMQLQTVTSGPTSYRSPMSPVRVKISDQMNTSPKIAQESKAQRSLVCGRSSLLACFLLLLILGGIPTRAQIPTLTPAPTAAPEPPQDTLGRTTPRGAVLGFLSVAAKNDNETAAHYLNTKLKDDKAAELAHELFVVLNRRLPANLNQLSNRPEGSLANPLQPNLETIGTIPGRDGNVEIILERIDRGAAGSVWLFSRRTLDSIPDLYNEVNTAPIENVLPEFLTETKIANVPLFGWFAVFIGMPSIYLLTGLLNRILSRVAGQMRRRLQGKPDLPNPNVLPGPIRLLALVLVIRLTLSRYNFTLLQRQFWSSVAAVITIAAIVWLFILLTAGVEEVIRRRLARSNNMGMSSILRLGRSLVDILAVFAGVFIALYHFGMNPTAALAGLGVGGIAVALAAQKTLENFIGGTSIILDRVVRVGDTVKIGDALGAVEDIGLRSMRIRTLGRTVVSVPNGQIANASLENMSMRDKFWFRQDLNLHKETTGSQMRSFIDGLKERLAQNPLVERTSFRVSFLRFGSFSLDVEIFAYLFARDWNHFLQMQGELLLEIMQLRESIGIKMAIQPQEVRLDPQTGEQSPLEGGVPRAPSKESAKGSP
jgi:MscS family membrane protein